MSEKLITLEAWAASRYGAGAPNRDTLRRWARDGKIYPAPEKNGRAYFVRQNAQYVENYNDSDFMRRVRDSAQTQ